MKNKIMAIACLCIFIFSSDFSFANENNGDNNNFDFSGVRTTDIQYFTLKTKLSHQATDGTHVGSTIFRVWLKAETAAKGYNYTCLRFTLQQNSSQQVAIPALTNWQHNYNEEVDIDSKAQVFGIEHKKFQHLEDEFGEPISIENSYHIYNAFIDFHAINDVFSQPTITGKGIQNLHYIGDKIIHSAAFSEPPVHLGGIKEGSVFRNGEITLELKGKSLIDGQWSAIVEYDSGESSFKMLMEPMPNFEIKTVGSSHYFGDIYKNVKTNWLQKATLKEFVVSETILPAAPHKINAIIERNIIIENVSKSNIQW